MVLQYASQAGLARDLNVFSSLVNVNAIKAAENTFGLEVDYLPN
jgi:hypothetical protein